MKFFGHPLHTMLLHFPTALLPMDLVLSYLHYLTGQEAFGMAAFYCLVGGVVLGYLALLTGLLDLLRIPRSKKEAVGNGLIHGFINGSLIIVYTIIAYRIWQQYPAVSLPSTTTLVMKLVLVMALLGGNYLGGQLIYKYGIGIHAKAE